MLNIIHNNENFESSKFESSNIFNIEWIRILAGTKKNFQLSKIWNTEGSDHRIFTVYHIKWFSGTCVSRQDISFTRRGRGLTAVGALVFDKTISGRQLVFRETRKPINN